MIDRILVPLDGSRVAEQILPHLRRLLYRRDAEVILVRASVPMMTASGLDGVVVADALRDASLDYLRQIQSGLEEQGVRVRSVVRVGSAAGVILDVADDEKATMVAMATHGETGLKRLLVGSVARKVIEESAVPILVVRPFWSYELLPSRADREDLRPMRNILLPLDGTDDKSVLIPPLAELARLFEARVVLLDLKEPTHPADEHSGTSGIAGEDLLPGFVRTFQEHGISTVSVVGKGDPVREILETARSLETDLIALTSHARSGFLSFFSSSVTEKVLHDSTCPLLVVRSEAPVAQGETPARRSGEAGKDRP